MSNLSARETPDVETASESYASRFAGAAGRYLLEEQGAALDAVLADWRDGTVLDVGGGHAQLTAQFLRIASDVVVLGSDAESLDRIRRRYPLCGTAIGNLLALPFPERSFDLVVAVRLLPHVRNWEALVAELCRVARSTVIVDYPRASGFNSLTPMLFPLKRQLEGNTRHYRNFRDTELDDVLRENGFEPRARHAEFLLPMVVHRQVNGAAALRTFERFGRRVGLTGTFGSPVVLRADRRGS